MLYWNLLECEFVLWFVTINWNLVQHWSISLCDDNIIPVTCKGFFTHLKRLWVQAHFSFFFLNIWDFSMCSTSKWPQLNSFLRKKNHPPCNIWAMGLLVGRPKLHTSRHRIRPQHLTIQTLPQYVKIAMLGRTFMTSRSHGVSMILILFFCTTQLYL